MDSGIDCKWSIPLPRHSREGLSRLGALDTASLTLGTKLVRHLGANMSFFSTKIEKMVLERKSAAVEDQPYVPKTTVVTREEIETIFSYELKTTNSIMSKLKAYGPESVFSGHISNRDVFLTSFI